MISRAVCALSLCAALAAPATAELNRKMFGQWVLSCDGHVSPTNCVIEQEFKLYDKPAVWARIRVTFDVDDKPEARVIVPHTASGKYLFYIVDGWYMRLPMQCSPDHCEGRRLDAAWIHDLAPNRFLWVRFVADEGVSIPIPFALPGIEDAINEVVVSRRR